MKPHSKLFKVFSDYKCEPFYVIATENCPESIDEEEIFSELTEFIKPLIYMKVIKFVNNELELHPVNNYISNHLCSVLHEIIYKEWYEPHASRTINLPAPSVPTYRPEGLD